MDNIQYVGELLWPQYVGHLLILTAFFSILLATYSFFQSTRNTNSNWLSIGKNAYIIHGVSVLSVIGILFFLLIEKRFEYSYVQAHVSDDLPLKYIFSAFWEGQEGSFLLWLFWHVVLGFILISQKHKWTGPVMIFMSLIQVFIISMIVGVHFDLGENSFRLGVNPLTLLRDTMNIPLFSNAEYVELLQGTGLNPLLQNYWMTIHPPVLFLGFASVSVPFAFAAAGLLTKDHIGWLRPSLKWAYFSAGVLGVGILMGAAWAYEALSFGGYWAWDPVENSSLVPWITLIAGIHANLIAINTRRSIKTTYWMYLISLILIVYSTTLTRSGVLGDTSVHAFTEMGLETQLFTFIFVIIGLSIGLYMYSQKSIPSPPKEESTSSREFWMFIGSLVLLFSALMITFSTSLPLFNKIIQLFNPEFTSMVINEPIQHYNNSQVWIGILIALLSGVAQFLRYKDSNSKNVITKAWKYIATSLVIATILGFSANFVLKIQEVPYLILLFACFYSIVANVEYFIFTKTKKFKLFAILSSHLGFAIMLIGVLATGINQNHISTNRFMFEGLMEDDMVMRNVQLIKERPMFMSNYWVTYESDSLQGNLRYFNLHFRKIDENNNTVEEFRLHPNAIYANDFSKIASFNPDTKHYWNKDIFTHIAGLPSIQMDSKFAQELEDTLKYEQHTVILDEWTQLNGVEYKVSDFDKNVTHPEYHPKPGDVAFQMEVQVQDTFGKTHTVHPAIALRNTVLYKYFEQINDIKSRVRIHESSFENLYKTDFQLDYTPFELRNGESFSHQGYTITFNKISEVDSLEIPDFEASDISVKGILSIENENGEKTTLQPKFLIRKKQIIPMRDSWVEEGIYVSFTNINPQNGAATFQVAKSDKVSNEVIIEVAENVPRNDVIVLEAIVFPGINLFWIGSILMLSGLFVALLVNLFTKK